MDAVRALVTFADLDDRSPDGRSISARHEAVLASGRRVLLLDDRGWTSGRAMERLEDVERTARVVVGPDEPWGNQTRAQVEAGHWAELERRLRAAGVSTENVDLRALPHTVELSLRLRRRLT